MTLITIPHFHDFVSKNILPCSKFLTFCGLYNLIDSNVQKLTGIRTKFDIVLYYFIYNRTSINAQNEEHKQVYIFMNATVLNLYDDHTDDNKGRFGLSFVKI